MPRLHSIRLVAAFDLRESLSSRKAIVLIALYTLGSLGGSLLFVRALTAIRERLEEELGQQVALADVMAGEGMARIAGALAGDAEVARAIVAIPPMALFYGWLAMTFVPLLVLFTSADAVAGDVASGAVRFSLFRTDRVSWAAGKLIGQTCLLAVGVLAGALACWLVGLVGLDGMPPLDTALWLLRISGRTIVYGFAYLGIVLCASQLATTPIRAGGLALGLMFVAWFGGNLLQAEPIAARAPALFEALSKLFPNGHHLELWHPGLLESAGAIVGLVVIGLAYSALGFLRFSRRDA
jgi:ABC-type transport system involved in multi-copper enzyme maturation permease subunit